MEINAVTPATSGFQPSGRRRPGNQIKDAAIKTCLGPAPLSLFCSGTEFRNSLVRRRSGFVQVGKGLLITQMPGKIHFPDVGQRPERIGDFGERLPSHRTWTN
jgi:hypothetical protein